MARKVLLMLGWMVMAVFGAGWAFASPVPDTGQTKCYDDVGNVIPCPFPGERFYGQDGNYNINPPSYTKLDSNGDALSDSATSWVMVRDNITGLIWEVKHNMDWKENYSDPHDVDNNYTWYDPNPATNGGNAGTPGNGTDTKDFLDALNDAHFGGYSDWRLPTIKELGCLVDYSIPYPGSTLTPGIFPIPWRTIIGLLLPLPAIPASPVPSTSHMATTGMKTLSRPTIMCGRGGGWTALKSLQ